MKKRNDRQPELKCNGGYSHGCRKTEHSRGREYFCARCKKYMGCSRCCQTPTELICLSCKTWALPDGLTEHGPMLPAAQAKELFAESLAELIPYLDRRMTVRATKGEPHGERQKKEELHEEQGGNKKQDTEVETGKKADPLSIFD